MSQNSRCLTRSLTIPTLQLERYDFEQEHGDGQQHED